MFCPNCGYEQNEVEECKKCGIVFSRYEEHKKKGSEHPKTKAPNREATIEEIMHPLEMELSITSKIIRIIIGLACIFVIVSMFYNGTAFSNLASFIVLLFYAFFGLLLIISFKETLKTKRFAWEMAIVTVFSLISYFSFPDFFSLTKPSFVKKTKEDIKITHEIAYFAHEARNFFISAQNFLEMEKIENEADWNKAVVSVDITKLKFLFSRLSDDESKIAFEVYADIKNISKLLEMVTGSKPKDSTEGPAKWIPSEMFNDIINYLEKLKGKISYIESEFVK